jgi:hypothetical protein
MAAADLASLRAQLRTQLLRAAEALADARWPDEEALALTRNTAAAVALLVDTVTASPLFAARSAA